MADPKQQAQQEWDWLSSKYLQIFVPIFQCLYDVIATNVANASKHRSSLEILDVGCGPGEPAITISRSLHQRHVQHHILGIDLSEKMIQLANARSQENKGGGVVFQAKEVSELVSTHQHSFDFVNCSLVLMYMPNALESLQQMSALLKPDGLLCAAVWGPIDNVPLLKCIKQVIKKYATPPKSDAQQTESEEKTPIVPFQYGEITKLKSLITDGGFHVQDLQTVTLPLSIKFDEYWKFISDAPFFQQKQEQARSDLLMEVRSNSLCCVSGDGGDMQVKLPSVCHIVMASPKPK